MEIMVMEMEGLTMTLMMTMRMTFPLKAVRGFLTFRQAPKFLEG